MADLTYRRATVEEHAGLRPFVLANYKRNSEDAVGCLEQQLETAIEYMLLNYEGLVYIVAEDEGQVVGCYVVDVHPRSMPGFHLRVIVLSLAPGYDQAALYFNMNVALTEFIHWPGCCGNSWSAVMPPGPALDFISGTEFGEGMTTEPYAEVLVHVTARAPSTPVEHTDVPRL